VPDVTSARIVRRHLAEAGVKGVQLLVLQDACRLPLPDSAVHAVALEDVAASAFGLSSASLDRFAAELQRVVAPGGTVFLGLENRIYRWPPLDWLRSALQAKSNPDSLNRLLKRRGEPRARLAGYRAVLRSMRRHGFSAPQVYAPLPDERATQVVIPIDEAPIVRYFLDHLLRRDSRRARAAIAGARLLLKLGLLRALFPYWFFYFTAEGGA
jgi:hypothetical protein